MIFFQTQENKCKILQIIPYNFNGNCYEIITFVCLWILSGVPMTNVAIIGDEQVLHIIEGVQTIDANVSDEEGSRGSKREDDL
jgi:hypothetical protein